MEDLNKYIYILSLFSPFFFAVILFSILLTKTFNKFQNKNRKNANYWLVSFIIGAALILLNIIFGDYRRVGFGVIAMTAQAYSKYKSLKKVK